MTYNEAAAHIRSIVGSQDWVRFPLIIRATPLMLGEGKAHITDAKEFVQTLALSSCVTGTACHRGHSTNEGRLGMSLVVGVSTMFGNIERATKTSFHLCNPGFKSCWETTC